MDTHKKILIAEGDRNIRRLIGDTLAHNGYKVLFVRSGSDTVNTVRAHAPDAVLIGSELPDTGCITVLRELWRLSYTGTIVISMNADEKEKTEVLQAGALEYLTVPFSTERLLESVRHAVSRRTEPSRTPSDCFMVGGLLIDYTGVRVMLDGRDVKLTTGEFRTIALLSRFAGKVLTYDYMIRCLWNSDNAKHGRTLRVNINKLRSKIEDDPSNPRYIFNEKGVGYRLADK